MAGPRGLRLRLHPDVHLRTVAPGEVDVVRREEALVRLRGLSAGEEEALRVLAGEGDDEDALADRVLARDGAEALAVWYHRMERMAGRGALRWTLEQDGGEILHAEVLALGGRVGMAPIGAEPLVLSRFTSARRQGAELVLESARCSVRIVLADGAAAGLVHALAEPTLPGALAGRVPDWTDATVATALGLLVNAGCVVRVDADGVPDDEATPHARMWEAEDLRFHAHTRLGHHERPVGGTYPFRGHLAPLPALRTPRGTRVVSLQVPDAARRAAADPSLLRAMEARRSVRPPFARTPDLDEVATLLWRCARVRSDVEHAGGSYETRPRPHPSGGATYPLEWYVVHRSCPGIDAGVYRYLPDQHALEVVRDDAGSAGEILAGYGVLRGGDAAPPLVVVLTARFGRVSWKYRSVTYALVLKEVGVVLQNLYLVATAMGLGGCALGSGDDVLFGRVAGLDPLEEAAVGEFLLGGL